ncbi:facilitated trehalose transporter Tret1-like [Copidosoma floridanum]|uniref:facilitated trehalose transporter Tret1-like n=1 Tax=Copidosoma floridanum TaxID=29053 RepID=UPI0006C954B8|nr:facilitated trehalose transporter Tret1-like [Copidosoma floridanum]
MKEILPDDPTEKLLTLIDHVVQVPRDKSSDMLGIYLRQGLTSLSFISVSVLIGLAYGHSAVLLDQLNPLAHNGTQLTRIENGIIFGKADITIDALETQSWIASVMVLFMCPGGWVVAIGSKKVGRKTILCASVALFTAAWILIAFANDVYHIIIGRSMSGLCIGVQAGLMAVYQGECSLPKFRTTLNVALATFFCIGMEVSHALGIWLHWRTIALLSSQFGLITLFLNYKIPESPIWLLNNNRMRKAIDAWMFFRGDGEFEELRSMYNGKPITICEDKGQDTKGKNTFCTQSFLKPLRIVAIIFTVTEVSGMGAVTFYCIQIFSDILGPKNAYIPTLILDSIRLFFAIMLSICSRRFSSRALILFSAFSCSTCLILLCVSLFFEIGTPWSALILLLSFESSVIMGLGPLPWTFCGELFPVASKEMGLGIVASYNYALCFIVVKMNPQLLVLLKPWGTFLLYGILTFVGSIILYFVVPNTKGKSLKEIELMFSSHS